MNHRSLMLHTCWCIIWSVWIQIYIWIHLFVASQKYKTLSFLIFPSLSYSGLFSFGPKSRKSAVAPLAFRPSRLALLAAQPSKAGGPARSRVCAVRRPRPSSSGPAPARVARLCRPHSLTRKARVSSPTSSRPRPGLLPRRWDRLGHASQAWPARQGGPRPLYKPPPHPLGLSPEP
jgi:hypothetical protein